MELPEPGVLYFILIGLSILFGIMFGRKLGTIMALSISLPIFLLVGGFYIFAISGQLPPEKRNEFLCITIGILLVILLAGTSFGRMVFASFLGSWLYDIFRGIFRMFTGLGRGLFRIFRN